MLTQEKKNMSVMRVGSRGRAVSKMKIFVEIVKETFKNSHK